MSIHLVLNHPDSRKKYGIFMKKIRYLLYACITVYMLNQSLTVRIQGRKNCNWLIVLNINYYL